MRTSAPLVPFMMALLVPLAAHAQAEAPAPVPEAAPAPSAEVVPVAAVPAPAPAPAPASAPAPAAAPATPPVTFAWEALADMYYLYNFTGDPSTQGPLDRQFDQAANSFSLNYAKLGVGVDSEFVAFRMDLGAGHTAAIINSAIKANSATPAASTGLGGLSNSDFLIQQAFGTWKITPALTLDAGRFVTSASAEVIEANKNWLYSRSMLFFGVPLLHTGVRLNATLSPSLKLQLSLVNGWNNDLDNNVGKTGGASLIFAPPNSENTTVSLTSYVGKEGAGSGGDTRILVDGVFTRDIGKASVGANVDYYKNGEAWWVGGALMGRLFLTDSFNLAARGEVISSKKGGFTGGSDDTLLYEGTAMAGYVVAKHFELRAEVRGDMSDKELFKKAATNRKNQFTGTLAFLTYF